MPVSLDRNPKHKAERERHLVPLFLLMQKKKSFMIGLHDLSG